MFVYKHGWKNSYDSARCMLLFIPSHQVQFQYLKNEPFKWQVNGILWINTHISLLNNTVPCWIQEHWFLVSHPKKLNDLSDLKTKGLQVIHLKCNLIKYMAVNTDCFDIPAKSFKMLRILLSVTKFRSHCNFFPPGIWITIPTVARNFASHHDLMYGRWDIVQLQYLEKSDNIKDCSELAKHLNTRITVKSLTLHDFR